MATDRNTLIIPVILCGGSGVRLWPHSRENHPKQFLSLTNDFSLLQNTMRRALRISGAPASNLVVVTLGALKDSVHRQLAELDETATQHILSEPSARDTGAAIALAAEYIRRTFGDDTLMWVLPSDHHIAHEDALALSFRQAIMAATSKLVTFGITPSRPETGYGYILVGENEDGIANKVEQFVEKPDAQKAQSYLDNGNYLWNSGMFLFSTTELLRHYTQHAPDILASVQEAIQNGTPAVPCGKAYAVVPRLSFDRAIMEKSNRVAVVPCDPGWSDIGSWESLWEMRDKDKNGNAIKGRAACFNANGCLIQGKERLIAVAGLDDIVVVETEDVLLIANKCDSLSLKTMVNGLKDTGIREALDLPLPTQQPAQPWTMVKSLGGEKNLSAREITIAASERKLFSAKDSGLSLYTVLEGTATILTGDTIRTLDVFQSAEISTTGDYTIVNNGPTPLRLIEVQKDIQEGIFFGTQEQNPDTKKVA